MSDRISRRERGATRLRSPLTTLPCWPVPIVKPKASAVVNEDEDEQKT